MITERTLKRWRIDSLKLIEESRLAKLRAPHTAAPGEENTTESLLLQELNHRILRLTQELLDQEMVKRFIKK
jgi:hypothetical protein